MNITLPNDLAHLQTRFEYWRKTRTTRSRIPEDLLQAARGLLDRYSASLICRACRLHPTSLSKRARTASQSTKSAKPAGTSAVKTGTAFYSLPPALSLPDPPATVRAPAKESRLVLERADGARLTLVLPPLDAAALAALCSNFLRA